MRRAPGPCGLDCPYSPRCHSRESGIQGFETDRLPWTPAFAGVTGESQGAPLTRFAGWTHNRPQSAQARRDGVVGARSRSIGPRAARVSEPARRRRATAATCSHVDGVDAGDDLLHRQRPAIDQQLAAPAARSARSASRAPSGCRPSAGRAARRHLGLDGVGQPSRLVAYQRHQLRHLVLAGAGIDAEQPAIA